MKRLDKDKGLSIASAILGVCIIVLSIFLGYMIFMLSPENKEYSRDNYYQMTHELTEESIKFYMHDSQVYTDNSFKEPVGTLYKREDGTVYLKYNEKEYDLDDEDLEVRRISSPE